MPRAKTELCDLCKTDYAVVGILCEECADSISRLLMIRDWIEARPRDKELNQEQVRILEQFLRRSAAKP